MLDSYFLGRYFMLAVFRLLALALCCPLSLSGAERERWRGYGVICLANKVIFELHYQRNKEFVWRTVAIPDSFWLLLFIAIRK